MAREAHQKLLETAEIDPRVFFADFQLLADFVVEVFKKFLPRLTHGFIDFEAEFELKLVKCGLDLVRLATLLIDGRYPLFEIDAGFDRPQHLVAGAEYAFKELELLRQELILAMTLEGL